jgi:hypothetical protein
MGGYLLVESIINALSNSLFSLVYFLGIDRNLHLQNGHILDILNHLSRHFLWNRVFLHLHVVYTNSAHTESKHILHSITYSCRLLFILFFSTIKVFIKIFFC